MEKGIVLEWKPLEKRHLGALCGIAGQIHTAAPERREVFAEKIALFPAGCRGLFSGGRLAGYGIAHAWDIQKIPALDCFLERLPEKPSCLYIHDVAVLPEARGQKAADKYVGYIKRLARETRVGALALVSLYGTDVFWGRFGFKPYSSEELKPKLAAYGKTAKYMMCGLDLGLNEKNNGSNA